MREGVTMRCAILLAFCLLPFTVRADVMAGADDPAFTAAFQRLLHADDPAALADLHRQAAQGNKAALVALITAETWFPLAGTQARRVASRQIDGHWITDLAAALSPTAKEWQGGAISPDLDDQMVRALALYGMGEVAKGDALLEAWFNHYPKTEPLPDSFADLPAAAWLKAAIIESRLPFANNQAEAILLKWLQADRIEGWMALSTEADFYDKRSASVGQNARVKDGRIARNLLWQERPAPPIPAATVAMILKNLIDRPQFAPVRAYCAAACRGGVPACETAFVTVMGQPFHDTAQLAPNQEIMSLSDFFATPRGEQALLHGGLTHHLGLDRDGVGVLTNNPGLQAVREIDACFADGAMRALSPFPSAH